MVMSNFDDVDEVVALVTSETAFEHGQRQANRHGESAQKNSGGHVGRIEPI